MTPYRDCNADCCSASGWSSRTAWSAAAVASCCRSPPYAADETAPKTPVPEPEPEPQQCESWSSSLSLRTLTWLRQVAGSADAGAGSASDREPEYCGPNCTGDLLEASGLLSVVASPAEAESSTGPL